MEPTDQTEQIRSGNVGTWNVAQLFLEEPLRTRRSSRGLPGLSGAAREFAVEGGAAEVGVSYFVPRVEWIDQTNNRRRPTTRALRGDVTIVGVGKFVCVLLVTGSDRPGRQGRARPGV